MAKRIYIAGKVSGLPCAEVTHKFGLAQKHLESMGYEVVNPLAVVAHQHSVAPKADRLLDTPWHWCMRWCIIYLMACDGVVLLPCWVDSRGARLEHELAKKVELPIYIGLGDPKLKQHAPQIAPKKPG